MRQCLTLKGLYHRDLSPIRLFSAMREIAVFMYYPFAVADHGVRHMNISSCQAAWRDSGCCHQVTGKPQTKSITEVMLISTLRRSKTFPMTSAMHGLVSQSRLRVATRQTIAAVIVNRLCIVSLGNAAATRPFPSISRSGANEAPAGAMRTSQFLGLQETPHTQVSGDPLVSPQWMTGSTCSRLPSPA